MLEKKREGEEVKQGGRRQKHGKIVQLKTQI
jgi:hypothetical protein